MIESFLAAECEKARAIPSFENSFKRLYLNLWTETATAWLSIEAWNKCVHPLPDLSEVLGRGALDLASTTDLTAFVMAFKVDKIVHLIPHFFVPQEGVRKRALRDAVPYESWVQRGFITATPGRTIDYQIIRAGGRLGFTVWAPIEEHMLQKLVVDAVRQIGNPAVAPPLSPAGAICEVATCLRLLRESGFVLPAPSAEKISSRASIDSAQQLITLLNDGTVRMSSVIRSLPNDKSDLLITTLERSMERYREGDVYKVPVAAILAVGVKA